MAFLSFNLHNSFPALRRSSGGTKKLFLTTQARRLLRAPKNSAVLRTAGGSGFPNSCFAQTRRAVRCFVLFCSFFQRWPVCWCVLMTFPLSPCRPLSSFIPCILSEAGAFRSGSFGFLPDTEASAAVLCSAHFTRGGCPLVIYDPLYELLLAIRRFVVFCSFLQRRPLVRSFTLTFSLQPNRPPFLI